MKWSEKNKWDAGVCVVKTLPHGSCITFRRNGQSSSLGSIHLAVQQRIEIFLWKHLRKVA